jgi:hypothetical protein
MIWLPPDLFTSQATWAMKDQMPYVIEQSDGRRWIDNNGASYGKPGGEQRGKCHAKCKHAVAWQTIDRSPTVMQPVRRKQDTQTHASA